MYFSKSSIFLALAGFALVSAYFIYLPNNRGEIEAEHAAHLGIKKESTSTIVNRTDLENIEDLKSMIAGLQSLQSGLLEEIKDLNARMSYLDSRVASMEAEGKGNAEQDPENELGLAEREFRDDGEQSYQLAEETFYGQGFDLAWDAEMTASLDDVESILADYSNGAVAISSQECRSDMCRVVFSSNDDAPPLYPVMLSAKGASKMVFDSIIEDGVEKTVVIYQR